MQLKKSRVNTKVKRLIDAHCVALATGSRSNQTFLVREPTAISHLGLSHLRRRRSGNADQNRHFYFHYQHTKPSNSYVLRMTLE
jgi:hypothetical protein